MVQTAINALQEYSQKNKLGIPIYTLVKQEGPAHYTTFTIRVTHNSYHAEGTANTKKLAKHYAAMAMVELLNKQNHRIEYEKSSIAEPPLFTKNLLNISPIRSPISELQEICMKYGFKLPIYEECNVDLQNNFTMRCTLGKLSVEAKATSKKEAKQNCAKLMRDHLINMNLVSDNRLFSDALTFDQPTDLPILKLEELYSDNQYNKNLSTEKAKSLFPDMKKNVGISVKERNNSSISNFHSIFKNSFDSTKIDKFQTYFKNLKFEQNDYPSQFYENILENITNILSIKITKQELKTKNGDEHVVSYKFNTEPVFIEIGTGNSYSEAYKSALIRTINAIHLFLT